MPISVVCSECDAEYQVSDNLAGQRIRCRECEAPLRVPKSGRAEVQAEPPRRPAAKARPSPRDVEDEDDDRPRRRRRDEDDEDDDRPRRRRRRDEPERSPVPLALLIGGGVLLFLVVAGIGAGWFLFRRAAPAPVARPGIPQANPFVPPPVQPGDNNPPAQPPAPLPPPLVWNVVADAPPAPFAFPDHEGAVSLGRSSGKITLPSTLSPFVAFGSFGRNSITVHDLRTLKPFGTVEVGNISKLALSPDGTHLAAHSYSGTDKGVRVWTVADGKLIDTFDEKTTFVLALDFAAGGRLLVATNGNTGKTLVRVWDPAARREASRFEVDPIGDWGKAAFSPGRRFLALPGRHDTPLRVYDLNTGRVAGELRTPAVGFAPDTQGMAFSADGSLLATLIHSFDGDRLFIWEVAGGKLRHDHQIGKDNVDLHGLSFGGERRGLEWLPDGTALLLAGRVFVDAASGKVYWKLPGEHDRHPSRVLSASRIALVKDVPGEGDSLQVTTLPTEQMAQVRKAGGTQGEAASGLPPAKAADWSAVKNHPAPSGVAAWKATADAAPKGSAATDQAIPLRVKGAEIDRVLLAAAGGRAAVLSTAAGSLGTRRQVRLSSYDLASGKEQGDADLFAFEPTSRSGGELTASLSPDGSALLVVEPRQGKRVDVWSATGKHLAAWSPIDKEQLPRIRWAGLLDAGRALTLSEGGRLIQWKLPECQAVWAIQGVFGAVGRSPGGKYLAVRLGSTYELLAADSGERVGSLAGVSGRTAEAFAFRPDGQALAAVLRDGSRLTLVRWDLTRGASSGELPLPLVPGSELAWVGDDALLVGAALIDLKLRLPVVSYQLPGQGRAADVSADGRYWYAAARGGEGAVLASRKLPDAAATQTARTLATTPLAIAPGMKVTVQVNGGNPGDANLVGRVRDSLSKRVQEQGFVLGSGGLTLTVQLGPERATGKTHEYRSIGGRGRGNISIAVKRVDCTATLTDGRGSLWNAGYTVQTPDTIGIVRTDNLEKSLSDSVWRQVESWGSNVMFPTVAVRGQRGLQLLPVPVFLDGR